MKIHLSNIVPRAVTVPEELQDFYFIEALWYLESQKFRDNLAYYFNKPVVVDNSAYLTRKTLASPEVLFRIVQFLSTQPGWNLNDVTIVVPDKRGDLEATVEFAGEFFSFLKQADHQRYRNLFKQRGLFKPDPAISDKTAESAQTRVMLVGQGSDPQEVYQCLQGLLDVYSDTVSSVEELQEKPVTLGLPYKIGEDPRLFAEYRWETLKTVGESLSHLDKEKVVTRIHLLGLGDPGELKRYASMPDIPGVEVYNDTSAAYAYAVYRHKSIEDVCDWWRDDPYLANKSKPGIGRIDEWFPYKQMPYIIRNILTLRRFMEKGE